MLRIRYDTDPDFCAILHFVGNLDEELAAIDQLLSDEKLLKLIEADLSRRYPHTTQTGRNSTPVEVIVRMLVLNRAETDTRDIDPVSIHPNPNSDKAHSAAIEPI